MYSSYYKVGGKLKYNHPTYVERKGDRKLFELLQAGEYCLVLNSRQMGKSSLQARTMKKLEKLGIKCASIDLTLLGLGNENNPEKVIKGFADELISRLGLECEFDLRNWWTQYQHLSLIHKLYKLIESVVLIKIPQKIVIFIDEIDSLLSLPNRDDFFAFIRACYNKRADDDAYNRLCFCLLGVISPTNILQDKQRTPFNIGQVIELAGLTFFEARDALVPGLVAAVDNPEATLKEIIYWTGGQPFLTQKLCTLTVEQAQNKQANISEIAAKHIIEGWENQDVPEHLRTIRDRLLDDETKTIQLLGLYQQVLAGAVVAAQNESQIQLSLSGLVIKKDNQLQVYNPIYKAIFNSDWVQAKLDNLRPYSTAINNWQISNRDEQFLLQGEALETTQHWAKSRSLSSIDYQFLSASQELQVIKERADNKFFVQQATQKVKRSKKLIAATLILASAITWGLSIIAQNQRRNATVSDLNSNAIQAKQTFKNYQELEGLKQAIQEVNTLKTVVGNQQQLDSYPTTDPLKVLNEILNSIQQKNQINLKEGVSSLTSSSDGQTIIIGGNDGTVRLWNLPDNQVKILHKLPGRITNLVVRSDDKIILSEQGGSLQILDSHGNLTNIFKTENVTSFSLSADEQYIVAGNSQGDLTLCTKDGDLLKTWSAHQGNITSIAFSPNGEIIASSSDDTTIALFTKEGKRIATLNGHPSPVNSIAFSPDGKLASGSSDRTIKLWSADGKLIKDLITADKPSSVNSVAFSLDGKTLISGSSNKIKLWNINLQDSLTETGILQDTLIGHQSVVTSVIYSPDGTSIISGDEGGTVKLWQSPPQTQRIEVGIFSRDRQTVLSSQPLAGITIQKLDGTAIDTLPAIPHKIINNIAMSPDQTQVIAGTEDGAIALIDLNNSRSHWQFVQTKPQSEAYQGRIIALDFHPHGNSFISVGLDNQSSVIKLWDQQGNWLKSIDLGIESATAVDYSPQGNNFILARNNGEIELWNSDGSYSRKIVEHKEETSDLKKDIANLSYHPDGKTFVIAYRDGTIQLRRLDGTLLISFDNAEATNNYSVFREAEEIKSVDFSLDGKTILAINPDQTISAWDIELNTLLQRGCQWLENYQSTPPQDICAE